MKNFSIAFFLILLSASKLLAQNQDQVKATFQEYWKYNEEKNVDKIMNMLYPKLFEEAPREMMQQALTGMFLDPSLGIEMKDSNLKDISPIITVDGISFSKVDYTFTLLMSFAPDSTVTKKEHEETSLTMLEIFRAQYGASVTYDKNTNTFSIYPDGHLLAILDPSIDDQWRFLEIKPELLPILEKILGKKVIKKLEIK